MRGGFQVTEEPTQSPPDLLLYTPPRGIKNLADEVRALIGRPAYGGAPVFVIVVVRSCFTSPSDLSYAIS